MLSYRLAKLYFKLHSKDLLWLLYNKKNILKQKKYGRTHDALVGQLSRELRENGIAVTHLDEFFPESNMHAALSDYVAEKTPSEQSLTKKTFLRHYWDDAPMLDLENPFIKITLDERILRVINNYNRLFSYLYYFTLNKTMPVSDGTPPEQSQKWHRDPEDRRMTKIFIYLNDVDRGAGPFLYVKGSQYGGRLGHLFPQDPPRGCYPPAEELEARVPPHEVMTCTGRAGTLVFADTAGLHRGGYATEKERIMFTAGYCSRASAWPRRFRMPETIRAHGAYASLTPHAQFALGFKPHPIPFYFLKKIKKNLNVYS